MANFKHFGIIGIVAVCTATFIINTSNNTKKTSDAQLPNSTINLPSQVSATLQDSLPKPTGYVNDFENIYTSEEEKKLTDLLANFEKNTQIQIALVTINISMTTKEELDAFTLQIANEWGVGKKNNNNGITVGISKGHRKMRICNGYGIQHILSDNETQGIIANTFIPAFKEGSYFKGTMAGLTALTNTITTNLAEKIKH